MSNIIVKRTSRYSTKRRKTRKGADMSRTISNRTHKLSEKMDAIVRRMNSGEITAEDVVRQLFPMAMASFVQASQECEEISQNLDEIEGRLLEARTLTKYLFEFLGHNKLLDEFQEFMDQKMKERIN
jgi:hypothetical protein